MFLPWRNSATEMFVNLGIHSFDEMLRIFVFSFRSRMTASHNQLLCNLCSAHCSVYLNCGHGGTAYYIYSQCHYLSYAPAFYANLHFIPFVYILVNCIVMDYVYTLF